jgi:hypothetical protein
MYYYLKITCGSIILLGLPGMTATLNLCMLSGRTLSRGLVGGGCDWYDINRLDFAGSPGFTRMHYCKSLHVLIP